MIAVILFVARNDILGILKSLNERISDPRSKLTAGPQGITLETQLNAVASQVESLQINQDQLTSFVRPDSRAQSETQSEDIPPELLALANEYLNISDPDWRTRVYKKDQCV